MLPEHLSLMFEFMHLSFRSCRFLITYPRYSECNFIFQRHIRRCEQVMTYVFRKRVPNDFKCLPWNSTAYALSFTSFFCVYYFMCTILCVSAIIKYRNACILMWIFPTASKRTTLNFISTAFSITYFFEKGQSFPNKRNTCRYFQTFWL